MAARLDEVVLVEIAEADLEHVGVVPGVGLGVEGAAGGAVVGVEHTRPTGRDVVAGPPEVADLLAPAAHVGLAPGADREDVVAVRAMLLKGGGDLHVETPHARYVGAIEHAALH